MNTFFMEGQWHGYYQYNNPLHSKITGFDKTNFTITITRFDNGTFEGIVKDDIATGGMPETGVITGKITNQKIYFLKQMPRKSQIQPDGKRIRKDEKHNPLHYRGILNYKTGEIKGNWKFKLRIALLFGLIPFPYSPGSGSWSMRHESFIK